MKRELELGGYNSVVFLADDLRQRKLHCEPAHTLWVVRAGHGCCCALTLSYETLRISEVNAEM